jgi:hypothetical protein
MGTWRTNKDIGSLNSSDHLVYLYNDLMADHSSHPIFVVYMDIISSCVSCLVCVSAPLFAA